MRGAGIAVFGVLGARGGPVRIALVTEFKNEAAIGYSMATVMGVLCPRGAICLALGFRAMHEASVESARW